MLKEQVLALVNGNKCPLCGDGCYDHAHKMLAYERVAEEWLMMRDRLNTIERLSNPDRVTMSAFWLAQINIVSRQVLADIEEMGYQSQKMNADKHTISLMRQALVDIANHDIDVTINDGGRGSAESMQEIASQALEACERTKDQGVMTDEQK